MTRLLLIVLALFVLAGCGDDRLLHQDGSSEYILQGEQKTQPGPAQWRAWFYVAECTNIYEPNPNQITWWKVARITEHPSGRSIAGLANFTRNHIYIQRDWWDDWRISGAEILHLKLGVGVRDGDDIYRACSPMRYKDGR